MLTADEQKFVTYWSVERTKKQRSGYRLGLRLGILIAIATLISAVTGWHKQALSALRSDSSTILVIVVALLLIVVFISVFAGRYQWEQREQRYRELMAKQARP